MLDRDKLLELYNRLLNAYGPQHWWPAETAFEVMVGAVLTQNTAWINVEQAIANLKDAGKLALNPMSRMTERRLARLIRPSGYFNIKARRLKALCSWLQAAGGVHRLRRIPTERLRPALLAVHGIGPESADAILLYAFKRPVFVIDAYTRRLLKTLNLSNGDEQYDVLRSGFESALAADAAMFNEYHALIVRHAKEKCINTVACRHCRVEKPIK
ncbi:MAG: endonuclease [Gammaproteobacteria bacterium RIFCSPLOWO2_12_FULL_52_10]|nr:MAG: endonuclease [Gammaproteobacteria bacterium RIFCSPLOWO2_12_FULL_52_10]